MYLDDVYWAWQKEGDAEGLALYRRFFRHARFKKGSTTTVQNSYQPTKGEVELAQASADYAKKVAPNAYYLNDVARKLLQDSLGTVQVDYNSMNNEAQKRLSSAVGAMGNLVGKNDAATQAANGTLGSIAGQTGSLAAQNADRLGALSGMYKDAAAGANGALTEAGRTVAQAAGTANGALGDLAQGVLPKAYQQNMEGSIRSALTNTIGRTIAGLGNRGVLNSSVTTGAMNDIERNASDEVARQYHQNISQVADLTRQQNQNTMSAANTLAGYAQQQLGNTGSLGAALQNIYNTQHSQMQGALGQQANLAQQQWSNAQGNSSQNSGLLSNLANMAGSPIALAAAAQEAAQSPAFNAWNASMGLNGATTNALAGIAGKGTSTQTTHQSGGGGFLGGLLGGALGGAANSLGAGLFCFPQGTMVKMADGTEKRIEHVEAGDKVMAWGADGEEEAEVLRTMKPHHAEVYNLVCSDGHTMATLSQPLLTEDGDFVTVEALKMKQRLKNAGEVCAVSFSGDRWVYDLEVSGPNTYIADGFVAKGGGGSIWQE